MLTTTARRMWVPARACSRLSPATSTGLRHFAAGKINGTKVAASVTAEVKEAVAKLLPTRSRAPGLATVLVGSKPDSEKYVMMKRRKAEECGFISFHTELPVDVSQKELLDTVRALNSNSDVDGILVQLPLPDHIDQKEVLAAVEVGKDVDGFHPTNMGKLARAGEELKQEGKVFSPLESSNAACTPLGCIELLLRYDVPLEGADVVVIGRSNIVGLPVALMLLHRNCTVTVCHARTKDIEEKCRKADIIISAVGIPEMVKGSWVKEGAVVIDVGINVVPDTTRKSKTRMCGDVDFKEVSEVASLVTPVPGGVGPMTVAMLMRNTFVNWKNRIA